MSCSRTQHSGAGEAQTNEMVADQPEPVEFNDGQEIIRQDEPGDNFSFVLL